jgi:RNA polymerase sigma-70 factor (ECF subfamily)
VNEAEVVELYERHAASIYRYCVFRTGSPTDAEDATAETFARLVRSGDDVASDKRDRWLLKVAKNVCTDVQRRSRREGSAATEADPAAEADEPRVWTDPRVREAVGTLTAGQQQIVFLRVLEGRPFADIGRLCGRSEAAVRMQYHRAVNRLRRRLADMDSSTGAGSEGR